MSEKVNGWTFVLGMLSSMFLGFAFAIGLIVIIFLTPHVRNLQRRVGQLEQQVQRLEERR